MRRRDASSRKVVVEECRYDTADEAEPSDLAASSSLRTATSAPEASAYSSVHSGVSACHRPPKASCLATAAVL